MRFYNNDVKVEISGIDRADRSPGQKAGEGSSSLAQATTITMTQKKTLRNNKNKREPT